MIQLGTIKFRRISKNYFGQFVWIEKKGHYNSRVSHHAAPTIKELCEWKTSVSRKKSQEIFATGFSNFERFQIRAAAVGHISHFN